jgi:hypothetical protein
VEEGDGLLDVGNPRQTIPQLDGEWEGNPQYRLGMLPQLGGQVLYPGQQGASEGVAAGPDEVLHQQFNPHASGVPGMAPWLPQGMDGVYQQLQVGMFAGYANPQDAAMAGIPPHHIAHLQAAQMQQLQGLPPLGVDVNLDHISQQLASKVPHHDEGLFGVAHQPVLPNVSAISAMSLADIHGHAPAEDPPKPLSPVSMPSVTDKKIKRTYVETLQVSPYSTHIATNAEPEVSMPEAAAATTPAAALAASATAAAAAPPLPGLAAVQDETPEASSTAGPPPGAAPPSAAPADSAVLSFKLGEEDILRLSNALAKNPEVRIPVWNAQTGTRLSGNDAPRVDAIVTLFKANPHYEIFIGQNQDVTVQLAARARLQKVIDGGEAPMNKVKTSPKGVSSAPPNPKVPPLKPVQGARRGSTERPVVVRPPVKFDHVFYHQKLAAENKALAVPEAKGEAGAVEEVAGNSAYGVDELQPVYGEFTSNLIVQVNALVEYYKTFARRIDFHEKWKGGETTRTKGKKLGEALEVWLDYIGVKGDYRNYLLVDVVKHIEKAWLSTEGYVKRAPRRGAFSSAAGYA